jgi:hypothetical protein
MSSTPLRRADLLADQAAHPPFGHRRFMADDPPVRVGTTGTGADLVLLVWSSTDLAAEIAAGTRVLGRLGVRPGMRVANTLPGALATPGALLLGDVNEAIGALDVPLGTADTEAAARAAWELVDRVQCEVLVLAPETAATFLAAAPAAERPWLAGIVWLSRAGGAERPVVPESFRGWQRTWLAVPEVASFAASSCARGVLHADSGVGADVAGGELVLTPHAAAATSGPYATGISARAVRCPCGGDGPAFEALVAPSPIR